MNPSRNTKRTVGELCSQISGLNQPGEAVFHQVVKCMQIVEEQHNHYQGDGTAQWPVWQAPVVAKQCHDALFDAGCTKALDTDEVLRLLANPFHGQDRFGDGKSIVDGGRRLVATLLAGKLDRPRQLSPYFGKMTGRGEAENKGDDTVKASAMGSFMSDHGRKLLRG